MSNHLPIPAEPHPDWSRLLDALWAHGRDFPDHIRWREHVGSKALTENLVRTIERSNEPAMVRPSSLLSCARQAYLLLQGHEPAPMPVALAPSFGTGHLVEAMTRAYLYSALPDCFELTHDTAVPLPAWWPKHERFRQQGTNDFTIRVRPRYEQEAAEYLDLSRAKATCIFDLKTAGQMPYDQHKRVESLTKKPDGFGYSAQITVYAEGCTEDADAVLMMFNRNSPSQGVKCRGLRPVEQAEEAQRLKDGLANAVVGHDPGREFQQRWGKQAEFYCSASKGYCNLAKACAATPVPGEAV